MSTTSPGITIRLPPALREQVQRIVTEEKRSAASYVELLIERDIEARRKAQEEAERVIRVYSAPELMGKRFGKIIREKGETDAAYKRRQATISKLVGE